MIFRIFGVIFICFLSLDGCKNKAQKSAEDHALSGTVINLPKNMYSVRNGCILKFEDSGFYEKRKKFVSIVDANCPKCIIDNLNKVDSMVLELIPPEDTYFVLNVKPADSMFVFKNFIPQIRSDANILWGGGYHFESQNGILSKNLHDRTFMLDENNRIIAVGNPLIDHEILMKYKELVKE